jgi:hypothetical protein
LLERETSRHHRRMPLFRHVILEGLLIALGSAMCQRRKTISPRRGEPPWPSRTINIQLLTELHTVATLHDQPRKFCKPGAEPREKPTHTRSRAPWFPVPASCAIVNSLQGRNAMATRKATIQPVAKQAQSISSKPGAKSVSGNNPKSVEPKSFNRNPASPARAIPAG